jgi:group I intron endonuclease
MSAAVYAIVHVASGDSYIGSSVDIDTRWRKHRETLRRGAHHSRRLQAAWVKFGEAAFVFKRLVVCAVETLYMYEQRLIHGLKPAFNIRSTGYCHTPESKAAIAKARRDRCVVRDGMTLPELCAKHGFKRSTVNMRLRRGWTLDQALSEPLVVGRSGPYWSAAR